MTAATVCSGSWFCENRLEPALRRSRHPRFPAAEGRDIVIDWPSDDACRWGVLLQLKIRPLFNLPDEVLVGRQERAARGLSSKK